MSVVFSTVKLLVVLCVSPCRIQGNKRLRGTGRRDKRESKCIKFLLTLGPEGLEEAVKMFFLFAVLN